MNPVDIAIVTLVGTLAVLGLRRGLLLGTLDLLGVVAALVVAALSYGRLVDPLAGWGLPRGTAAIVAFAAVNVAAQAVFSLATALLFRPLRRLVLPGPVRWADGVLGLIPGAVKGLALAAVLVIPLAFLQRPALLGELIRASRLADPLVAVGLDLLYGGIDRYDVDLADFTAVTSRPTEEGITLPFAITSGLTVDEAAEAEMLGRVNAERAAAGLDPLAADPGQAAVGRAHGEEMFRAGYFAHVSPTTGAPNARLDAAGVTYLVSGENLAYAPSVGVAHRSLMDSPGHRANILNPVFTRLGVGAVRSLDRGLMFAQEFAA